LQNNGGNNLPVGAGAGAFAFAASIASGLPYNVSVFAQPSSPSQTCSVTNGQGTVTSANITNVSVNCVANAPMLSGVVTYTYYSLDQTSGINYTSPTEKPIRGAVVELRNSSGTVLASQNTTATGGYSFSAPANSAVRIVVKAALGSPDAPHVTVVDNTNGGALYSMYLDIEATSTNAQSEDFNAGSGWGGTRYSGNRTAAPFAILDTIYQAEALIKGVDPNVNFPALIVHWSKYNTPTEGDKTNGEIGTSYYDSGNIYILGAEDLDTDEYDAHVMAHEWAHYFEDKLGRSDSIGGSHGGGDILDPRLAFSEGWGTALSGMVFNDPSYIDTGGVSQATTNLYIDIDSDSVSDSDTNADGTLFDGFYSEASVQEALYDLFDSGSSDDDNVSLGLKPIYDVMVGGQKTTSAYTTIFSFLKYLKDANPINSADIDALAAAENIGAGDEYEAYSNPIYTGVPVDGSTVTTDVDGYPLQTWDINGPITDYPGNRLFNRMFFVFSISSGGDHTIEVTPTGGANVFFELNEKGTKTVADNADAGYAESLTKTFSAGDYVMEVGSYLGPATFTVTIN